MRRGGVGQEWLPRSMTIKAINTIMTERIWVSRVASEIVFQHWRSASDVSEFTS